MIEQLASVSLSCSAVILLLLFLRPLLCRRYRAKLRYWIWLALAVRLLVPLSPSWPASPVALPSLPETAVSFSVPLSGGETAVPAGGEVLTPAVPSLSVSGLLTAVWAAGAVVFLAWHLLAAFFFRRKAVRWSTMFQNGRPDVLMCKCTPSPMLIGLLHPVILLPDGAFRKTYLTSILHTVSAHAGGALGEAYGEKTSMPGLSSAQETPGSLSYFDELTDASQIRDSVVYFEDWTPETDPKQMETMLGGRDFSRIDVRFTLQAASPEEGGLRALKSCSPLSFFLCTAETGLFLRLSESRHGHAGPLRGSENGSLPIGAEYFDAGGFQLFERHGIRMAVIVIHAAADDGILRRHRVEESRRGRRLAAVVTALEHGRRKRPVKRKHFLLARLLRIAGKEEAVLSVGQAQHDGVVVQIAVVLPVRGKNGQHGSSAAEQLISRLGGRNRKSLVRDALEQVLICFGRRRIALRNAGHHDLSDVKRVYDCRHAADMIGMRMRRHNEIERLRSKGTQLADKLVLCRRGSCINQDVFPARQTNQLAVALTDIKEINLERSRSGASPARVSLRGGNRRACFFSRRIRQNTKRARAPQCGGRDNGGSKQPQRLIPSSTSSVSFSLCHGILLSLSAGETEKRKAPHRLKAEGMPEYPRTRQLVPFRPAKHKPRSF